MAEGDRTIRVAKLLKDLSPLLAVCEREFGIAVARGNRKRTWSLRGTYPFHTGTLATCWARNPIGEVTEVVVLALLRAGHTSPEIAAALKVDQSTVRLVSAKYAKPPRV